MHRTYAYHRASPDHMANLLNRMQLRGRGGWVGASASWNAPYSSHMGPAPNSSSGGN